MRLMLLALFFLFPQIAHADVRHGVAVLACNEANNTFAVRLGHVWNDDKIDQFMPDGPNNFEFFQKFPNRNMGTSLECTLSNEMHIEVSIHSGQAFPYGLGGGDPDVFFTLKINDKPIFYKKIYYSGYGSNSSGSYGIHDVYYQDGKLEACADSSPAQCKNESARLLPAGALTAAEFRELKDDQTREDLFNNLTPFCREIHALGNGAIIDEHGIYETFMFKQERFRSSGNNGHVDILRVQADLNNDRKIDTVLRVSETSGDCVGCGNHFFDGSYLFFFPSAENEPEGFIDFIKESGVGKFAKLMEATDKPIYFLPEWGAYMLSFGYAGSSPRYVYNVPIIYKSKYYVYSFETNIKKIPVSSLTEIMASNSSSPVCLFPYWK